MPENSLLRILPDIASALASGASVVALESSVLAQGLPIPQNREAAERMTRAVTSKGATPAITAVVAVWLAFEIHGGSSLWITISGGMLCYAVWLFFLTWPKTPDNPPQ